MVVELIKHQVEGADWLSKHPRAGLFDEMGTGKTGTLITALDLVKAKRILVVCPAAVREVWKGEFKKFSVIPRRILKGAQIGDLNLWLRGRCDVLLLSYEMATKWAPKLGGDVIDAIIFDEAHALKSSTAARTRAMLGTHCDGKDGLARWGEYVWMATGTPMPNDPTDIWPWLRFTRSTALTLGTFTSRYFRSRMGAYSSHQTPRPEMVSELKQVVEAQSLRRTKAQAGLNLPPIWVTTQTVDGNTDEIRNLLRQHPGMEKAVLEAVEAGGLTFLDAQHIATLRRLVGEAKAPAFAELLKEDLVGGMDKVVVMGLHTKALDIVRDKLRSSGLDVVGIDGRSGENDRSEAVRRFQTDPACRVFVGNIKAAGTGLTLTAASDLFMLESSWSPADNAQAIMRVHRIGQTSTVRARFISLSGSIDEQVSDVVARKTAAITQIVA